MDSASAGFGLMGRCNQQRDQLPRLLGKGRGSGTTSRHKGAKAATQAGVSEIPKGAISTLQEYVQCSQTFHVPSNYSVLQWSFDSQMADAATLEFRAIVAFMLEGVPHHIAGTWQPKKKDAQRDAAERALALFVGRWGNQAFGKGASIDKPRPGSSVAVQLGEEDVLAECCETLNECGGVPPTWNVQWQGAEAQATVEMTLHGVPHHFPGAWRTSEVAARADAARRVLWYLQRPGFQHAYEPDPSCAAIVTMKIPSPPADWAHGSVEEGALEVAERKTAIMRVQNRLQQTFSHDLRPGMSVWTWSYEMNSEDESWPVLCRASVDIPVVGKVFTGNWVQGQRDAQLDTIQQVICLLDELESRSAKVDLA